MRMSEQWLHEWVDIDLSTQALAEVLTMLGLEVSKIASVAGDFHGVIVAQVTHTTPHPAAERLTLCQVEVGSGAPLPVVCGAFNVRPGLKVALATVGARLPNDLAIKSITLRGAPSEGMLCAAQELGLHEHTEGIIELPQDAPIGVDLREYLKLDDVIVELELTPNRGDCLSMLGVARELGAKFLQPVKRPVVEMVDVSISHTMPIMVEATAACPLYMGRVITGLNNAAVTPIWMKERLIRVGIQPVHPVVDVTQYVMIALGQPMHAFDVTTINEKIVVREALTQETLTLLDGRTVELSVGTLVIADAVRPIALAGMMGGEATAVTDRTDAIFLESAFFTPQALAGQARQYGLMTDASYRFERGVDPTLPAEAMEWATALILEIAGGKAGAIQTVQQDSAWFTKKVVSFRPTQVEKVIGLAVPEAVMKDHLTALGFELAEQANSWQVMVPPYRFDIAIEADLIGEIIRVQGYQQLTASASHGTARLGQEDACFRIEKDISQLFSLLGYRQCINYSFVDPKLQSLLFPETPTLALANPLSPELSHMRVSLWPGLLASMVYNVNRQQTQVALFEVGTVFDTQVQALTEIPKVAALLAGTTAFSWQEKTRPVDWYDLKGAVQATFRQAAMKNLQFEAASHPALHPGKTARLLLAGKQVGWCGALHPRIVQLLDVSDDVYLFECELHAFSNSSKVQYQVISKFPQIRRDLALIVEETVSFAEVEAAIRSVSDDGQLKAVYVFDLYTGSPIPAGKKSLAITLLIQSIVKTLNEQEVNQYIEAVIKTLQQTLSCILRDGGHHDGIK